MVLNLKKMSKIPTAEEFLDANTSGIIDEIKCKELMIEFAKLHVEAALEEASEEAEKLMSHSWEKEYQQSIINSYPLTNIK